MKKKLDEVTWNSPDSSGNEQGWTKALWIGVLRAIQKYGGKGHSQNPELHQYLVKNYPETAWETDNRSYFSDYSKAWTITNVAKISTDEMILTPLGHKIAVGEISIFEGLKDFVLNYESNGNYVFRKILIHIHEKNEPQTIQQIYNSLTNQTEVQASEPRSFKVFFFILELMGVICERKSKWSIYDASSFKNIIDSINPRTSSVTVVNPRDDKPFKKFAETFNCIYYGPPGTGKTKAAQYFSSKLLCGEVVDSEIPQLDLLGQDEVNLNHINFYSTQFHPSFSYEDFIEGLRPIQVRNSEKSDVSYLVTSGVFKVASELARAVAYPGEYGIEVDVQFARISEAVGSWEIGENSLVSTFKFNARKGYFTYKDKKIHQTGANDSLFVPDGTDPDVTGIYKIKWYSEKDQNPNFVILIDELNRGNPSSIFGEALSLIEKTKRIGPGQKEQTFLTLPYSKKQFGVPLNLHIICAMNSSDKSLISIDQAFRRRFKFHYVAPDFSIITSTKFEDILKNHKKLKELNKAHLVEIKNYFEIINKSLKDSGFSEDNHIGHSYAIAFLSSVSIQLSRSSEKDEKTVMQQKLKELWRRELHPLIRDIVGEFKISDFCTNLCSNLTKMGDTGLFGPVDNNIHKHVTEFLNDPSAKEDLYPWKQSA